MTKNEEPLTRQMMIAKITPKNGESIYREVRFMWRNAVHEFLQNGCTVEVVLMGIEEFKSHVGENYFQELMREDGEGD